ncbi:MAG: SDR family NAD(P)-dependent oxidoreductase [Anaeromyxobacter sp.]
MAQRSLPEGTALLGSLRRDHEDWRELSGALAALWVRGVPVDFEAFDRPYARRRVDLATYPFQRRRFWLDRGAPGRAAPRARPGAHPLLGGRLPTAVPIFEGLLTLASAPYLAEHRLDGAALLAGPVYLELAQAAAQEALGPAPRDVEGFSVLRPFVIGEEGREVQTHLGVPDAEGAVPFSVHGRAPGDGAWELHATGRLAARAARPAPALGLDAPGPVRAPEAHYARLAALGIALGPSFRTLQEARGREGQAEARLVLPAARAADPVAWAHPCLLDGALQAVGLAMPEPRDGNPVHLFTGADRISLLGPLPAALSARVALRTPAAQPAGEIRADVVLAGEGGAVLGFLEGIRLRRAPREAPGPAAQASTACYEVAWTAAPARPQAAGALRGPAALAPALRQRFEALAAEAGLQVYDALLPELDRLASAHADAALRALGFDATAGRGFTAAGEAARLGVVPRHARLFARLLDLRAEDGALRRRADGYEVADPGAAVPPNAGALARRFAPVDGELAMLQRCGEALPRVLRGEQDPLPLLFPDGGFEEARRLYEAAPSARAYNAALAEALRAAAAGLAPGQRLRVLEIGAGTGGTTAAALAALPAEQVQYTFTDLSPLFLERAAERFGAHPGLRRALLDVERDPAAQGFEPGAQDVVIAANVLHAAADLRQALAHVRRLLAPGGLLLLLEGTTPERWVDLTFGLTEGWWRFSDAGLRPAYPLLGREAWRRLLAEAGFAEPEAVPADQGGRRGAQQALLLARAPRARRLVLVEGEDGSGGVGEALAARLRARGDEVAVLAAAAPDQPAGAADVLVYLGGLGLAGRGPDDAGALAAAHRLAGTLPLRWLARAARGEVAARTWLVTRGAVPAEGAVADGGAWQAPLWGLGRGFALEHPGRWGGLVDLPAEGEAGPLAEALLAVLESDDGEDQVAWRGGTRRVARLQPAAPPPPGSVQVRPDATYLVTGGFGGLGLLAARWLAERGARHVALLGRRPDPAAPGVREVEALGVRVHCLAGDVADPAALGAALARLQAEAPPLRGVLHAAAALGAAPLAELTGEEVEAMLRPKLDGTVLLERLTRACPLDFLVLFSSTTALLGATGLAHYAAANAFLDAFAQAARRRGRPVLSVDWGTWEVMRLASAEAQRGYREAGLEPMPAAEALEALGRLIAAGEAQRAVARVDWGVLKPLHEARRPRPFLALLGVPAPAAQRPDQPAALAQRLAHTPAGGHREAVLAYVREEVAAVLGAESGDAVPPAAGFFELGMDSLMSVELKRRLERGAGRPLPSTLTFNYPCAAALAEFLAQSLASGGEAGGGAAPAPAAPPVPPAAAAPEPDGALAALSEDELEARLRARLERMS